MIVKANLVSKNIITCKDKNSYTFFTKYNLGTVLEQDILELDLFEAFYLVEKNKLAIYQNNKLLNKLEIVKKFEKIQKDFLISYKVFKDLWTKGYVVKSGLKYGSQFRIYDTSKLNKQNKAKFEKLHSKWICYVVKNTDKLNLLEFISKNRIAHSTKKNLLMAVVSSENNDIVYYDINWIKP